MNQGIDVGAVALKPKVPDCGCADFIIHSCHHGERRKGVVTFRSWCPVHKICGQHFNSNALEWGDG